MGLKIEPTTQGNAYLIKRFVIDIPNAVANIPHIMRVYPINLHFTWFR
jgi:hypothetical protein